MAGTPPHRKVRLLLRLCSVPPAPRPLRALRSALVSVSQSTVRRLEPPWTPVWRGGGPARAVLTIAEGAGRCDRPSACCSGQGAGPVSCQPGLTQEGEGELGRYVYPWGGGRTFVGVKQGSAFGPFQAVSLHLTVSEACSWAKDVLSLRRSAPLHLTFPSSLEWVRAWS